ncbi:MAG: IclR family transcriptional regulator [Pseudomonadota bacterium]
MRTVDRALGLLKYFTVDSPEWGLSDLARAARMDKATTLRMLQVMTRHGFLAQDAATRRFRLGIAPLNLARVREATNPLTSVIEPVMDAIMTATNETTHASTGIGTTVVPIGVSEPQRSTRVFVDPSLELPIHAAASGLAYLAFGEPSVLEAVLADPDFEEFTDDTPLSRADVMPHIEEARRHGFSVADKTYDDEVVGVAAPFFDQSGYAQGTIAVATPTYRMSEDKLRETAQAVVDGALEITRGIGAEPSQDYLKAIGRTQTAGAVA